jgi:hypothetical protein
LVDRRLDTLVAGVRLRSSGIDAAISLIARADER